MDAISALMDGELGADEARRQIFSLKNDPGMRGRWDDFHLIGDAMRGESPLSPQFGEILSKRLAAEPTILAPRRLRSPLKRAVTYAMSAAASLVAAALVAWVAIDAERARRSLPRRTPAASPIRPPIRRLPSRAYRAKAA